MSAERTSDTGSDPIQEIYPLCPHLGICPPLFHPTMFLLPITVLERNHSLRSGKIPFSLTIPFIVAPVSPLAAVWTTMTPPCAA